jgi:hypothetical protein
MWKLYIDKKNGRFNCFRCGAKGSWFDFQHRVSNFLITNWEGTPIEHFTQWTEPSSLHEQDPELSQLPPIEVRNTILSAEETLSNPNEVSSNELSEVIAHDHNHSHSDVSASPNLNVLATPDSVERNNDTLNQTQLSSERLTTVPHPTATVSTSQPTHYPPEFQRKYKQETSRKKFAPADSNKLNTYLTNLNKYSAIKEYLNKTRGLTDEVIEKYRVGGTVCRFYNEEEKVWNDQLCVVFSWYTPIDPTHPEKGDSLVRYKYRAVNGKWMQRLDPVGGGWGMFGWHLITPRLATVVSSALTTTTSSTTSTTSTSSGSSSPLTEDHEMAIHSRSPRRKTTSVEQLINDTRAIVVTEGEFDAMSVYQATGIPAVSLPCGANCMPPEIIAMFEPFERIYLWLDDDVVGQDIFVVRRRCCGSRGRSQIRSKVGSRTMLYCAH